MDDPTIIEPKKPTGYKFLPSFQTAKQRKTIQSAVGEDKNAH